MGIYMRHFYFKKELPKVNEIKKKFNELTGLILSYNSGLVVNELVTEENDLQYLVEASKMIRKKSVLFEQPYFSCDEFDKIGIDHRSMQWEPKSFSFIGGRVKKSEYFYLALTKTMHELGGRTFRYSGFQPEYSNIEKYLEPYHPYKREWKRIKKWNEMNEVEQTYFIKKYT